MSTAPEHAGAADAPASFAHRGVSAARGNPGGRHERIGVVVARFNQAITDALFAGAVEVLLEAGVDPAHVEAVQVPGAVEVPLAARELAQHAGVQAIVALGCVIRGETSHYDYVCDTVTQGCLQVQLKTGVPVGFGVITAENADQAYARASTDAGGHNVGADAAHAALEMAGLLRAIRAR